MKLTHYLVIFIVTCIYSVKSTILPNILVIMVDDLGSGDVSYRSNNEFIMTPNIDALGYYGIIFDNFHAHATCTPSRGALMTGKFCSNLGLQHDEIENDQPWGMSPFEKTLPQYLKQVGYTTHLVGKWHLGFSHVFYNPMRRGFDTYYGNLGKTVAYQSHEYCMAKHPFWPAGYDMRTNETVDYSTKGQHVTELYTNKAVEVINNHDVAQPFFMMVSHLGVHSENWLCPFPSSDECLEYMYILNPIQRRLAGQISKLDSHIGYLIAAMDNRGMLNNSVVVLVSDNGAPTVGPYYTFGSNYPLKGQKHTPWEGATRVPGMIWSPLLNTTQYVSKRRIHMVDIFATLVKLTGSDYGLLGNLLNSVDDLTGINLLGTAIDGLDMWPMLSTNGPETRKRILHNTDDYISYTKGDWKVVSGTTDWCKYDHWLGHVLQRDFPINPYKAAYYDKVRNSAVARTLRKFQTQGLELSDHTIDDARSHAKIDCNNKCIKYCKPWIYPCLFNIAADPCEHENLYLSFPAKAVELLAEAAVYKAVSVPKLNQPCDCRANPADNQYTWTWWQFPL